MGISQEKLDLSLYSKKVLIKNACTDLVPHYLRFVKGVVDCEDIPLNISRENFQDSALIARVKSVITKRILKLLEDEMLKDNEKFSTWLNDFKIFLKEGMMTDTENTDGLIRILKHNCNLSDKPITIEEYIKKMKKDQDKIYYLHSNQWKEIKISPYLEPFNEAGIPVLLVDDHIDEIFFRNTQTYKNFKFVNIESSYEDLSRDLSKSKPSDKKEGQSVIDGDITPFCIWLKNEMSEFIGKVIVSQRLKDSPAIIVGEVSSSMRQIMMMVDPNNQQAIRNQTLEINLRHPLMLNLNFLRKNDPTQASKVAKVFLDYIMIQAGIPFQLNTAVQRGLDILQKFMESKIAETKGIEMNLEKEEKAYKKEQHSASLKKAKKIINEPGKSPEIRINEKGIPEFIKNEKDSDPNLNEKKEEK